MGKKHTGLSKCICLLALLATTLQLPCPVTASEDTVTWDKYKQNFGGLRTVGPLPDADAAVLALEFCEITEINPGAFDGLPNLKQIRLYHNKLQHLDPAVFTPVKGLKVLALQYNNLTEVPNFGELGLFPNMTKLKLNSNQISKLDNPKLFSAMVNLEYLNLQKNRIEFLHPDIFKDLSKLISITLYSNKIKSIPDRMFHIQPLERIYLRDNLISYVAPDAISSGKLNKLYLEHNRLTYLPEHFVSRLKTASPSLDYVGLTGNPWQCSCLQELMTEVNSTGVGTFIQGDVCNVSANQLPCNRLKQGADAA